jgi:hypothetical protein
MKALKILAMMVLMNALLLYPIAADAQSGARVDGAVHKFSKGMIIKKDRARFFATGLVFDSQSLTFKDNRTGKSMVVPLSEVEYVQAKTGSHAGEGALIGGGLFLLAALAAWAEAEADPNTEVTNAGTVIAIATAVGVGTGLVVGSFLPKERTVYQNNKYIPVTFLPESKHSLGSNHTITLVSLRIPF